MPKRNYEAIVPPSIGGYGFERKIDAIAFARERAGSAYVKSRRTGQVTRVLAKQQTSCSLCGNELNGRQHCGFCGELHAY